MTESALNPEEVTVDATFAVQLDCVASSNPAEIGAAMGAAFPRVWAYLQQHQLQCVGAPRALYTRFDATETRFTLAIPCTPPREPIAEIEDVKVRELPARRALRFTYRGPYDRLHEVYRDITAWLIEHRYIEDEAGWVRFAPMWEEYVSDPDTTPAEELVTQIYLPLD